MNPQELLSAAAFTMKGQQWPARITTLGRFSGECQTVIMTSATDRVRSGEPGEGPLAFEFTQCDGLDVQVIEASPAAMKAGSRYEARVVAQLIGSAAAGQPWARRVKGNGDDPVYGEGAVFTLTAGSVDLVANWQSNIPELLSITRRAILEGPIVVEGVLVVPAADGPVRCWEQRDENGLLSALLADFEPFRE